MAKVIRWSITFIISPTNEYLGLISFRIGWFGILAVQVALKSLLQHHNSKASILWCSAFLMAQLSQPYMTIGKNHRLTIQTFAGKMTSVVVNTHSGFIIAFLPRSKRLLISRLQSPSAVNLEFKKTKSAAFNFPFFLYLFAMK